jgi:uncharacterized peroxidase-related enzyme
LQLTTLLCIYYTERSVKKLNGKEMDMTTRISPANNTEQTRRLLDSVQQSLGVTPNMMRTMAHSPAALEGYLALTKALSRGALTPGFREQIALAVAQENQCNYCLSAHSTLGKGAGLKEEEILAARRGQSANAKQDAGLRFVEQVARQHGQISDEALRLVRQAGHSDAEIAEMVAHIALNVFTNYFNLVAGTEIDFPAVSSELE